jgi:hypothetical protein
VSYILGMDARNPDCLFLVLNGTDCSESFGSDCGIMRSSRDSMYLGLINRDLPQGVARCSPTGSTKLGRQSIPLGTLHEHHVHEFFQERRWILSMDISL